MSVLIWVCQPEWSTYQHIHVCFYISSLTMQRTSVTSLYDTPCMFSLSFFSFHWRTPLSPSRSCYCQPVGCNGRLRRNDISCSRLNVKNSTWLIQIAESLSGEDGAADREKMGKKFHDCNVALQKPQGLEPLALLFLKTSQRLLPTSREAQKQVPEQRYVEGREWNVASQEE